MTIRIYLAKAIQALWFTSFVLLACAAVSAAPQSHKKSAHRSPSPVHSGTDLASLVEAYREAPTAAHRAAVVTYAAAHPKDDTGTLAHLALGIAAYEQKSYPEAIAQLKPIQNKLPRIADYTAYYLAASRVESDDTTVNSKDLAPAHPAAPSPVAGKAWIVEARALKNADPAAAARLLIDHYNDLPQPDGDLTLADCFQAAKDLPRAVDFYQRVFFQYVTGDAAVRSAAALVALKDLMGDAYPQPLPAQRLLHADRLMELHEYAAARSEYENSLHQLDTAQHDQARVRIAACDFLQGNTSAAYTALRELDVSDAEAAAECLYYLEEGARNLKNEDAMSAALKELEKYPQSPWRLKALIAVANRYLIVNRPDDYVPLFKAAYENFPAAPQAAVYHWKVAFHEYLKDPAGANDILAEHLRNYTSHTSCGAALYFLGRSFEARNDPGAARAVYQLLSKTFENTYYAMLARDRLQSTEMEKASAAPAGGAQWLSTVKFASAKPVPADGSPATAARIERSRILRSAGFPDLADGELRFGARTDGQPPLLAMEAASAAAQPHRAMRIMKLMSPDYLGVPIQNAPRKFWELLFPLPYRADLVQSAQARNLDPFLLAGLIRQESEFNPEAVSPAKAYGLTQVRPVTGRQFARVAGVQRFSTRALYQPSVNLKIGSSILRGMLNQNNGSLERTLASYNAGPARVAEWLTWNSYREPAEFVESIPFTETREYVQSVLRNAEMYRRLYQN